MEALLLTLDVVLLVWLVLRVGKVYQSGDAQDLGIFRFREQRKNIGEEIPLGPGGRNA